MKIYNKEQSYAPFIFKAYVTLGNIPCNLSPYFFASLREKFHEMLSSNMPEINTSRNVFVAVSVAQSKTLLAIIAATKNLRDIFI